VTSPALREAYLGTLTHKIKKKKSLSYNLLVWASSPSEKTHLTRAESGRGGEALIFQAYYLRAAFFKEGHLKD